MKRKRRLRVRRRPIPGEREETNVCAVCGREANVDDVEDTNGWRWYSDGHGGVKPLCATCSPPDPGE